MNNVNETNTTILSKFETEDDFTLLGEDVMRVLELYENPMSEDAIAHAAKQTDCTLEEIQEFSEKFEGHIKRFQWEFITECVESLMKCCIQQSLQPWQFPKIIEEIDRLKKKKKEESAFRGFCYSKIQEIEKKVKDGCILSKKEKDLMKAFSIVHANM